MAVDSTKDVLHRYLRSAREALLWKLDGLSEYDVRRPLTPTGTNLLGLIKHVASVQVDYFGETFGRDSGIELPWFADGSADNADMWATAEESSAEILDLWHRSAAYGDETVAALDLDAPGRVPWWPAERADVTLGLVLTHLIAELNRHAGHADIIRELIDGQAGLRAGTSNLPDQDTRWWSDYRERLERTARRFAGSPDAAG